jgi:hypothetical protein
MVTFCKRQGERAKKELAWLVRVSIGSLWVPAEDGVAHMRGLHAAKPLPSFFLAFLFAVPLRRTIVPG